MEGNTSTWERALIAVIRDELAQLEYLVAQEGMGVERSDIHSQISRLSGLTDLVHADGLSLTEATRDEIQLINDHAMGLGRIRGGDEAQRLSDIEFEAAQSLFDAVSYNIPYLCDGDTSKHALALSRESFSMLKRNFGQHVDFDLVEQVVLVQDYRVMKLAGKLQ